MKVFVDTSAFYALASETDSAHGVASEIYAQLKAAGAAFVTTNYVFLEAVSLLQRRHGVEEAERFGDFVAETVEMIWMTARQHQAAWEHWTGRRARGLSLVDCSCFMVMRDLDIRDVFAFDAQFQQAGFHVFTPDDRVAERPGVYRVKARKRVHAKAD